MAKTFIEAIGYRLGRKAAQAKNAFELLGGSDEASLRAEIRLGRDLEAALLERTPLVEANEITSFVSHIVRWLGSRVTERKLPFRLLVTAEREPNATSLPGGAIFVSWPLLAICGGERDELAFMLGHEMAHIVRRHALDRLIKNAAISLLLRKPSGRSAASAWLSQAGRQELQRAYSREEEFEADAFAAALLKAAGGDPGAAERVLNKFHAPAQSYSLVGDYFVGHPTFSERIAKLRVAGIC